MKYRKKPVPGTANTGNGSTSGNKKGESDSHKHSNTVNGHVQELYKLLGKGKGEAVSMDHLAGKLGISERHLRGVVADARKHGALILSCEAGYFLPDMSTETGRADFLHYIRTMKARARHSWACAYVAEKVLTSEEEG